MTYPFEKTAAQSMKQMKGGMILGQDDEYFNHGILPSWAVKISYRLPITFLKVTKKKRGWEARFVNACIFYPNVRYGLFFVVRIKIMAFILYQQSLCFLHQRGAHHIIQLYDNQFFEDIALFYFLRGTYQAYRIQRPNLPSHRRLPQ